MPLAFWLGAWQLAAIWVDTVYTPGHGALLLPSPLLVWERLAALGLEGPAIGAAQRRLAAHILSHPEDNTPARLLALARAELSGP